MEYNNVGSGNKLLYIGLYIYCMRQPIYRTGAMSLKYIMTKI